MGLPGGLPISAAPPPLVENGRRFSKVLATAAALLLQRRQPQVGKMAFSGQGESPEGTMGTYGLGFFINSHMLERLDRVLCHRQLHLTSPRPLGCGYEKKAMPQAHFLGAWSIAWHA
jgi:hypothetical protein